MSIKRFDFLLFMWFLDFLTHNKETIDQKQQKRINDRMQKLINTIQPKQLKSKQPN